MQKVLLRELEYSDLEKINQWRNDKELIEYLGSNFIFINTEVDKRWFDSYLVNRDKAVRLAIIENSSKRYIGNVNLTNIHNINNSAEFSIFIGDKEYWSSGYGMDATKQMVVHGFDDLNLNRIYLTVLSSNERAFNMYKRVGFIEEGVSRQAVYKNGIYVDLIHMSVLKSDYTHS